MLKRIVVAALSLALLVLAGCSSQAAPEPLEKLGISGKNTSVITTRDTRDDAGKGSLFYAISFEDNKCPSEISEGEHWKELPYSDNITRGIYDVMRNENGAPMFPIVMSGYYYFEDRHPQSTDPHDDTDLLSRDSLSFTVAVYCTNTHVLHYAEIDA